MRLEEGRGVQALGGDPALEVVAIGRPLCKHRLGAFRDETLSWGGRSAVDVVGRLLRRGIGHTGSRRGGEG